MFQIFVDVSVGTGSGNTCVKIFFLVRKNLNSIKLFQKNIIEMASKDVGKWVSTYLDSNIDKLLGADNNCKAQGMMEEKEEGGDVTTNTKVLDGIGEQNIEEEVTIDTGDPLGNEMDCNESDQPGNQQLLVVKLESDSDIGQHLPKGNLALNGEALNSGSGPGILRPLTEEEEEAPEKKKKKTRFSVQDDPMRLLCGWWFCGQEFSEWSPFLEHVMKHLDEVYIVHTNVKDSS